MKGWECVCVCYYEEERERKGFYMWGGIEDGQKKSVGRAGVGVKGTSG